MFNLMIISGITICLILVIQMISQHYKYNHKKQLLENSGVIIKDNGIVGKVIVDGIDVTDVIR